MIKSKPANDLYRDSWNRIFGNQRLKIVVNDRKGITGENLLLNYFRLPNKGYLEDEGNVHNGHVTIRIYDEYVDEVINHIDSLVRVGSMLDIRFEIHQDGKVIKRV